MSTGITNDWLKSENAGLQLAVWAVSNSTPPIDSSSDPLTQIHEAAVTPGGKAKGDEERYSKYTGFYHWRNYFLLN